METCSIPYMKCTIGVKRIRKKKPRWKTTQEKWSTGHVLGTRPHPRTSIMGPPLIGVPSYMTWAIEGGVPSPFAPYHPFLSPRLRTVGDRVLPVLVPYVYRLDARFRSLHQVARETASEAGDSTRRVRLLSQLQLQNHGEITTIKEEQENTTNRIACMEERMAVLEQGYKDALDRAAAAERRATAAERRATVAEQRATAVEQRADQASRLAWEIPEQFARLCGI
ncbi:hypothetical protein L1887_17709 [Cichorium endivia]|nr:hypothetical protein L1887_17709 [Cichorium endivia]